MKTRARVSAAIVATVVATTVISSGAAGAATKPCKLLKRSEIERVLDQPVGKAKKGLDLQVTADCDWEVEGTAEKPSGVLGTFVQTTGAKLAFNENRKHYEEQGQVESVSGLGKAFYQSFAEGDGVVWVLKGKVLLTVQGSFLTVGDTEPAADPAELKEALVALTKIARRRL